MVLIMSTMTSNRLGSPIGMSCNPTFSTTSSNLGNSGFSIFTVFASILPSPAFSFSADYPFPSPASPAGPPSALPVLPARLSLTHISACSLKDVSRLIFPSAPLSLSTFPHCWKLPGVCCPNATFSPYICARASHCLICISHAYRTSNSAVANQNRAAFSHCDIIIRLPLCCFPRYHCSYHRTPVLPLIFPSNPSPSHPFTAVLTHSRPSPLLFLHIPQHIYFPHSLALRRRLFYFLSTPGPRPLSTFFKRPFPLHRLDQRPAFNTR